MPAITTIGLDLAKKVFHVHGVDVAGNVVVARRLRRKEVFGVLRQAATVSGRHGGVRECALLGA
jgi:transposase